MNHAPLISFVIPCFNDAVYIEQSINSALNQTYKNIEIIVVDDGSNAETKEILKSIEPKLTKLITQENKGQSSARNVGINVAKGKYIVTLDSDDFFEPTFCEKALVVFKENTNAEIVTCNAYLLYKDKEREIFNPKGGTILDFLLSNSALGTSMFKRDSWNKVKGYDDSMKSGFEDWEFFIRLLQYGGECKVIKEELYNYRKKENSTTKRANKVKYDLLRYIYKKNENIYKQFFYDFISFLLLRIEKEEKGKLKIYSSLEYKIGFYILHPFKYVKRMLNG